MPRPLRRSIRLLQFLLAGLEHCRPGLRFFRLGLALLEQFLLSPAGLRHIQGNPDVLHNLLKKIETAILEGLQRP